jgi:GNAT superfamily N-acetyltransferase
MTKTDPLRTWVENGEIRFKIYRLRRTAIDMVGSDRHGGQRSTWWAAIEMVGIGHRYALTGGVFAVVSVRQAGVHDAQWVFPLARDMATSFAVDHAAFTSSFSEILEREDAVVLLAHDADEIVGYLLGFDHLAFYANGRVAYVEEVAVIENRRREKIGDLLMHAFEEWATLRGSPLVTVATRRAQAFYLSIEYEETATLFRKIL